MQALHEKTHHERNVAVRQTLYEMLEAAWPRLRQVLMETLKLIICTIILLGFVAAIMWACGAWDARVFTMYVATAVVADMVCVLLDD